VKYSFDGTAVDYRMNKRMEFVPQLSNGTENDTVNVPNIQAAVCTPVTFWTCVQWNVSVWQFVCSCRHCLTLGWVPRRHVSSTSLKMLKYKVTSCLENPGNLTAVREMPGNWPKAREVSRKKLVTEENILLLTSMFSSIMHTGYAGYVVWLLITWPAGSNACPMLWLGDIYIRWQHHWSYPSPAVQHSATGHSLSPLHALGMLFHTQWHLHRLCLLLANF